MNVAEVNPQDYENVCEQLLSCDSAVTYILNLHAAESLTDLKKVLIEELDTHEIVKKVLRLLPEPPEISSDDLKVALWNFIKYIPINFFMFHAFVYVIFISVGNKK